MSSIISSDLKQESIDFLKQFLPLLALQLVIYTVLRCGYIAYNISYLHHVKSDLLFKAMVAGFRFDMAVVGPMVSLTLLMTLWLSLNLSSFFNLIFLAIQSLFISINVSDYELVRFVGRRFNKSIISQADEGFGGNLSYYYKLLIIDLILIFILFFFSVKLIRFRNRYSIDFKLLVSFLLVTFGVISGRGGLQTKPISFVDANKIPFAQSQFVVLNSTYTLLKSLGQPVLEKLNYFPTSEMLSYLNLQKPTHFNKELFGSFRGKNVVLIVVESLSAEYVNQDNTPFLDQLLYKGSYFTPAFANGRRSVEGIAALIAGVPALMDESFISSEFSANDFVGLGTLMKNQKYYTSFFHGGKNGTMRFDSFTKAAGFDQYFGETEFLAKTRDFTQNDGTWGIYDGPFLKYTCEEMTQLQTPFSSVVFTLSSHVPYKIPRTFIPTNTNRVQPVGDILKAINYTDFALRQFFECAEKQKYFKNTLFIITADHTGPRLKTEFKFRELFEIPLIFYSPDHERTLKMINTMQFVQQIDVMPTILDLVGIDQISKNHLARSVLYAGPKSVLLHSDHKYELFSSTPLTEEEKNKSIKAFRQYFSQGLYDNRLYFPARGGQ
jgi:phosphoglycerol transferase MdoB-like AlkP superfamily enzyme